MLGEQIDRVTGPFHLVGHSYGGGIALLLALDERLKGRIDHWMLCDLGGPRGASAAPTRSCG